MKIFQLHFLVIPMVLFFTSVLLQAQTQVISGEEREQLIQQALRFRAEGNYHAAVVTLDTILAAVGNDAPVLLLRGDLSLQDKNFGEAVLTYRRLLPLHFEATITQINLSYALFMDHQPAKALQYARSAWEQNRSNPNAVINYFNAMLWNVKTRQAARFLTSVDTLLSPSQKLVLQSRLFTTSGNYKQGLRHYDSLATAYPEKQYLLEYAEVLLGKQQIQQSKQVMENSKLYFSDQEYNSYLHKLKANQIQSAGLELSYFQDVAQNTRTDKNIWWQRSATNKYPIRLGIGQSIYLSKEGSQAKTNHAHANLSVKLGEEWKAESDLHLIQVHSANGTRYTALTGQQLIKYQSNDRRMLGVFYSSDVMSFTAELLGKNIKNQSIGYITHLMLNGKTGIYSQGSLGKMSDQNQRLQFFGSFYHVFRTDPTLKGGINFSAMHFKDQIGKGYFAPNQYLNTESFVDYNTSVFASDKFFFQTQAAAGLQKIEENAWDPAFRLQTELSYRRSHFETSLKYQTSNVASNTGTGYKFNWFTLKLVWKW